MESLDPPVAVALVPPASCLAQGRRWEQHNQGEDLQQERLSLLWHQPWKQVCRLFLGLTRSRSWTSHWCRRSLLVLLCRLVSQCSGLNERQVFHKHLLMMLRNWNYNIIIIYRTFILLFIPFLYSTEIGAGIRTRYRQSIHDYKTFSVSAINSERFI